MIVNETCAITGVALEGVTVRAGGFLTVTGVLEGDLRVDEGARAIIVGAVDGALHNDGTVDVFGLVKGPVRGSGKTRAQPGCCIEGTRAYDVSLGL